MKNKSLKKMISAGIMFALIFSIVPSANLTATTSEGENTSEGSEVSPDNQMLHFVMRVRWGNVIGEPSNIDEANFDGSISVTDSARVSLERTLLFEEHNETADKITEQEDHKLSWSSSIYNHWDGVKVLVSSPGDDDVTITTAQGSVTKTAREFYDSREPYIEDMGDEKEIVVKVYPVKNPKYFLKVLWGKTSRADYALKGEADEIESSAVMAGKTVREIVKNKFGKDITIYDASGYFGINGGGTLKLIKALRFEGKDEIVSEAADKIEWTSHVAQGVDGVLVKLDLDADTLDNSDTVTLNFTAAEWSKDFSIIDLYHDRRTNETIADGYGIMLQVWRKPNRSLIRVRNNPTVYMVEDGVKQPIPSEEVLYSRGLSFDEVEEVEQGEADTYGDGEAVCYPDGVLIREKHKNEVYVIADGEKKHIEDPQAFEDLFGRDRWNKIIEVKAGILGLYRNRAALKSNSNYPEGSLIREAGKQTVYLIEGGKKKPITSDKIFGARGLDWDKVVEISRERMEKISTAGATLRYPDGALIRDRAGRVYKMDQGKKRWVRSADDLTSAGYKMEDIIEVTDPTEIDDLAVIEDGDDVFADDVN